MSEGKQVTTNDGANTAAEQRLVGIGGWLILPAIGLVLYLIAGPVGLIARLAQMKSEFATYLVPAILVDAGLYIYIWVAAVRFFKKRSDAPQTMIYFMVARTIASVVLFVLGLAVVGVGDAQKIVVLLNANNFVAQGIAAAIWIPYFRMSKRVQATFCEPSGSSSGMNKLIFANLLNRPVRSIISVLAVAIEVVMILSIVGIFMGMLNDSKQRTNGIGADLVVRPSNTSFLSGVSGAPMSARTAEVFRRMDHVAVASPVITSFSMAGSVEILYGIDYPSYNALRPFTWVAGGPFQGPYDVIVDDVYTRTGQGGHHLGETIEILNHPFRICGVVESGKGGRRMVPIETLGELIGSEGKASVIYLKSDKLASEDVIVKEIAATRGLEGYHVQTMDELLSQYTPSKFPGFDLALNVVITIAVLVGFLVIFQTMYTAVLERTREIGILKSMGASKPTIVGVVLRECAVLAVAGVLLGIAATYGVQALLSMRFPAFAFELTAAWIARGAAIAFAGALCGALYPAWMAARKDPIDALAYE